MADLFTLVGITPHDKRKKGAEAASFKNPNIGMYYGKMPGKNTGSSKAGAQDNAGKRQGTAKSKDVRGSKRDSDALSNAMSTMQGTFIGAKK